MMPALAMTPEAKLALLKIAGVIVALIAFLGLTTLAGSRLGLHAEVKRKILHTGLGLSTLGFPLIFHQVWEMSVLIGIMVVIMMIIRSLPQLKTSVGSSLHDVGRVSFGEIFFALSVLVLFILSRERMELYIVPLLILTLSDAAAALVGVRYGRRAFSVRDGKKSLEGMFAFFVVAFVCVILCLSALVDLPADVILLTAFLIATLGALTEAVSWHGMDNIFVPLGCYLLLQHYLKAPVNELWLSVAGLGALTALALVTRRVSQLNTHALMMAMICACILLQVGGFNWFIIVVVVFGVHLLIGWLHNDRGSYSIEAVFCIVSAAFLWLTAKVAFDYGDAYFLYCLSMAIHIQIMLLLRLKAYRGKLAGIFGVTSAALLSLGLMMSLYILMTGVSMTAMARAGVAAVMMILAGVSTRVRADRFSDSRWVTQGVFALAGSLLGWLIIEVTQL